MEQRKGKWMETYTGIFYPIDPKSEEVSLIDIAHGLSLICRFGGQCKHFYSVAQHCLNVCNDLEVLGYDKQTQLIGLLHDASEAYICDIIRPFKPEIPEYRVFEERVENVIYERFGLPFPDEEMHKIIKFSDNEVLYNEVEQLMNNAENWTSKYPHRKLDIDTSFRNMREVEQEYLEIANRLIKELK